MFLVCSSPFTEVSYTNNHDPFICALKWFYLETTGWLKMKNEQLKINKLNLEKTKWISTIYKCKNNLFNSDETK